MQQLHSRARHRITVAGYRGRKDLPHSPQGTKSASRPLEIRKMHTENAPILGIAVDENVGLTLEQTLNKLERHHRTTMIDSQKGRWAT